MKKITLIFAALFALPALATSYDASWYEADYWSGEYPAGFSVVAKNVSVPARTVVDASAPVEFQCGLPFKAVFHPWNQKRPATYLTKSKIVLMTVKNDFVFQDEDKKVALKKGDVIEYLIYGAEGWFTVRINGEIYAAEQSLFENLEEVPEGSYRQDEWMETTCAGGKKSWILLSDLGKANADGEMEYLPGIADWWKGFVEYGVVRDLTDRDLLKSK